MKKFILLAAMILASTAANAKWEYSKTIDDFTGDTIEISKVSNDSKASFYIRTTTAKNKKPKTDFFYISGDPYICSSYESLTVQYKFDNNDVQSIVGFASTDNTALFLDIQPVRKATKTVLEPGAKDWMKLYEEQKKYRENAKEGDSWFKPEHIVEQGHIDFTDYNSWINKFANHNSFAIKTHDKCGRQIVNKFDISGKTHLVPNAVDKEYKPLMLIDKNKQPKEVVETSGSNIEVKMCGDYYKGKLPKFALISDCSRFNFPKVDINSPEYYNKN